MGRPRKMTTDQMITVVDSYYLARAYGNEKRLKFSLIATYAVELGYQADGYDFARNMEVREYIKRIKCNVEIQREEAVMPAYKSLDVGGFLNNNRGNTQLTKALMELDAYWKRIYEHAEMTSTKNRELMKEQANYELALKESNKTKDKLKAENAEISGKNNKLVTENRYLRKMLRKYLYPAVANEILIRENLLKEADTQATEEAVSGMTEFGVPRSLREATANDIELLSEEELLLQKMWGMCDE